LSGNVTVTGGVEMKSGADFSGANLDMTEGILNIAKNTLTANTLTGGTVSVDLKEFAVAGEKLITATSAGGVTLEVWPFDVTNKAVQHYILTSTNTGYSINFILPEFFAVSATPFVKENAMNIPAFDPSAWTGGDLYVFALNVAEIAVSELAKKGYTVTADMKNTTKKLADDLEDILAGAHQDNYQKINTELIYGFLFEDYARVKAILDETGTEATPAISQTARSNAQAVTAVVSSRFSRGSSVKGRSGGDFIAGNSAVWAQGMLNKAKLTGANGFDADSSGFAAGYEYSIDDSYKVGAGYAFASTDIKTDRSKTSVDTHTVFVYGSYKPDVFYVNGVLSYGCSEYDEKTKILGLESDYKADTFSVQAMAGYAFDRFTPEGGLRYTDVKEKAYTDALGAKISGKNLQTWTAVAGVKTAKEFQLEKGALSTQAGVALTYDLKQGKVKKSVSLANGTGYVVQGQEMNRFGLEIGGDVLYKLNGQTEIGLSYEGGFKKKYTDHTGMLNVKYSF
ncbi:MAG: autotransporter outer membrane beta-barrel domain-containing protein, partial [Alphaproteobacteria bacterium]|nr:autotransporter outer membrane beta-barrel domain-containing protein [Alphaproteobacteria bacterium]